MFPNLPLHINPLDIEEVGCSCGELETMEHIYSSNSEEIPFEKIYNGTIKEIEGVLRKFNKTIDKRKILKQQSKFKPPCDPTS